MTMDQALDLPAVEYAERSDPGRDPTKQVNEDACGHRETRLGHLCVVCDGMGGHAAGREAAELALATIFETFEQAPEGAPHAAVLRSAVEEASRRVYAMPTNEAGGRPGSTVVAVLMHARGTEIAHVGDSRVYLVHEGQIARVTRDHSIVQEMVDRGLLTLEQAAQHPDANRITRALGMAAEIEVEVRPSPVHHVTGDAFILCSDGLSDLVEDPEILDTVGNVPAAQAVGKLVDLANARGGHDNITVLVLRARTTALEVAGGIAPTIAQTSVPETANAGRTIVDESGATNDRTTELLPVGHATPAGTVPLPALASLTNTPLEPTMPPTFARPPQRTKLAPALVVGLVLTGVAIAVLTAVVGIRIADRARGATATEAVDAGATSVTSSDAARADAAQAPTTLVPGSVDLTPPSAPSAEPLAPLEPGPDTHHPPRRKKKQ
jgi:serine/threonine protein phosphatase PrpC